MKVGLIGMGIMGSRMATNLQKYGYEIIIFNRTQDKAISLIKNGALWADTPGVVAKQVEIIFTMLANTEAVINAALGENGFLDNLAPNTPLQWMQKDLEMVAIAANEAGVAIPVTSTVKELYRLAMQQGLSEKIFQLYIAFLKKEVAMYKS